MKIIFSILLTLSASCLNAQFFYNQVAPDTVFKVSTTSQQISTGQNIDINNSDESFTIAAWVNLKDRSCNDFIFGTDDIKISVLDAPTSGEKKMQFGIKDSIVVHAIQYDLEFSSLIPKGEENFHFAVTYDGGGGVNNMKMYINGTQLTNATVTNNSIAGSIPENGIKIGSAGCVIDVYNLKVWAQDLTSSQVKLEANNFGRISSSTNYEYYGSSRFKKSGFKTGFFQKWKIPSSGRLISIPLWDEIIDFSGRFFTNLNLYHSGKFYIPVDAKDGPSYSREIYMMVYDTETNNIELAAETTKTPNELSKDTHRVGSIEIGKDSTLILTYEDTHNADFYVFKSDIPLSNPITQQANIVGNDLNAYANLFYLGDTLYLSCRQQLDEQIIYRSLDDGVTWSNILDTISTIESTYWNYGSITTIGDSVVYLIGNGRSNGDGTGGNFEYIYLLKSIDASLWSDVNGSLSKSGWNGTELKEYALIDTVTNSTDFTVCYQTLVDTSGILHLFYYNQEVGYNIHTTIDLNGNVIKDTLTYSVADRTNPPKFIWKGGNNFDLWQIESDGSKEVLKKYQSTDGLETIDSGEVIYRTSYDLHRSPLVPNYQSPGQEVLMVVPVIIDANYGKEGLFIYNYNPWD